MSPRCASQRPSSGCSRPCGPTALRRDNDADRHAVVVAIVLRGDADARQWFARRISPMEMRDLIGKFGGAGCNEPKRARLRREFNLTEERSPVAAIPRIPSEALPSSRTARRFQGDRRSQPSRPPRPLV
jgi:hypothetical protein